MLRLFWPWLALHSANHQRKTSLLGDKTAVQLAREHRYAEAEATLQGVRAPADPATRLHFTDEEPPLRQDWAISLRRQKTWTTQPGWRPKIKTCVSQQASRGLQEQVENHVNPTQNTQAVALRTSAASANRRYPSASGGNSQPRKSVSEAAMEFAAASALAPDRGDLLYDLALANFGAGHLDDALASAEHAKSAADNGSLESLIGDIQEKRGDPHAAVHAYKPAVNLEPLGRTLSSGIGPGKRSSHRDGDEISRVARTLSDTRQSLFPGVMIFSVRSELFNVCPRSKFIRNTKLCIPFNKRNRILKFTFVNLCKPQK